MYGMQSIIWAFGSMIVLIGIISFLPIGLTIKGKMVVGIAGFVFSIGGLSATSTFPLWFTFLMLLVITFFTAYIMDSRMRKVIFIEKISPEEESFQDIELAFSSGKKERKEVILTENELTELKIVKDIEEISGTELLRHSVEVENLKGLVPNVSELQLQDVSKLEEIYLSKDEGILDELSHVNDIQEIVELSSISETDEEDWLEELSDSNLLGKKEVFEGPEFNDSDIEEGYLSEIESLLDEHQREEFHVEVSELPTIENEKNSSISEESWLDELWKSEVIASDEKNESKKLEIELELKDTELEILFAAKEVAASVEEREPEKKLAELQK